MRSRQTPQTSKELSSRQKQDQLAKENSNVVGLNKIPINLFEENSSGQGLLGTGKLKERPNLPIPFTDKTNPQGRPVLQEVAKFSYFFVKFDSPNGVGVASLIKNFATVKEMVRTGTIALSKNKK